MRLVTTPAAQATARRRALGTAAAVMVTSLTIHMLRVGKRMRRVMETGLERRVGRAGSAEPFGVFLFTASTFLLAALVIGADPGPSDRLRRSRRRRRHYQWQGYRPGPTRGSFPTNDQQICGVPRDEPLVKVGPDKSDTVRGLGEPLER